MSHSDLVFRIARRRRVGRWGARLTAVVGAASVSATFALVGASPALADSGFTCPTGPGAQNLCIPPQGANENVQGAPGATVVAGYDFTYPSGASFVKVTDAYEQLSLTCASNGADVGSIKVPMPDATYTSSSPSSQGWTPTGDESTLASYEGSVAIPDVCSGGDVRVGQGGSNL